MMNARVHGAIVAITIAMMALLLIGGSVLAVLLDKSIPTWMENADIAIIMAAFGASGFFAQTAQMDRQADSLGHIIERNHELAMAGTTMTTAMVTPTDVHAATENGGIHQ